MILVVDIGSSSLRAMLFDENAREVAGTIARRPYKVRSTADGGAELDPEPMFEMFESALDELLANAGVARITHVAASSLASNVLAVDGAGKPLTPAYLYSDTRNAREVEELRSRVDWAPIYARTGCPLHTSYLPARLLWIKKTLPGLFELADRWISLHEFFLLKLFGRTAISHSLASWTGLLNRRRLDWDEEVLALAGVRRQQLSPLIAADASLTGLNRQYGSRWPALAEAQFLPAFGDGAAANIGSGCTDADRVAVTVGTSGAVRVVVPDLPDTPPGELDEPMSPSIPAGLWLYTVDKRRGVLGGSLNNGGNVFAYWRRTLQLPTEGVEEKNLAALEPDAHGLTVLPFFAGERSPGYHGNARASIIGLSLDTSPIEILRATMEALAYRVAAIFELICEAIPTPREIIASGSALLRSPTWVQIISDVLGRAITVSGEEEATARGAALLALEAAGIVRDIAEPAPVFGKTFYPDQGRHQVYRSAIARQQQLYSLLVARG